MKLNVKHHLGAVERSVSHLVRDDQPANVVRLSRSYATTVDDLWDAVTNRVRIRHWFLPITGELESGGRYELEGNANGVITACERPSHFALAWEFAEDVSWVDVRVSENETGHAKLVLQHLQHGSQHWEEYGPGAVGVGWELGLISLSVHITKPSAPKLDGIALVSSPEGKTLISGSCELWGQAAIAAGTAPDVANAAAARTNAFYTGEAG